MKTLKLTASDFKETGSYYKEYCGNVDLSDFNGSVEIEENLGWVRFVSIKVSGSICAKAGSGIEAGWGIEAGSGIEAGRGIKAGEGIKAGRGIEAGWGIEAGSGIEAGWGIKAGWGIEAGEGITSFYSWIKAKLKITADVRCTISAGIFSFDGEKEIEAEEIVGAKVIYGKVKLLPKVEGKTVGRKVKVKLVGGEVLEGELVN